MVCVYEGLYDPNFSLNISEDENSSNLLILTSSGQIFNQDDEIQTPDEFYFFDISSKNMYSVYPYHQKPIKKYTDNQRIEDYETSRMYAQILDQWVGFEVPKGTLPEIEIVHLKFGQTEYSLDLSSRSMAIPLKKSDFQELNPKLSVEAVHKTATLSYLYIEFFPLIDSDYSINVRLIYKIFIRETTEEIKLKRLPPTNTLGVQTQLIYFADHRGDIKWYSENAVRLKSTSGSSTLVCIQAEQKDGGLNLTFRQRVEGNKLPNKNLENKVEKIPSKNYEKLTLYEIRNGSIYRGQRLLHQESYSENLILELEDIHGQTIFENILIEYGSLMDKQIDLNLDYSSSVIKNSTLDITDELIEELKYHLPISKKNKISFYYLDSHKGFDLKLNPHRCIIKLKGEAPSNETYFIRRRILVQETLRPISIRIRVFPSKNYKD